jgi:hypothetical protein
MDDFELWEEENCWLTESDWRQRWYADLMNAYSRALEEEDRE